MSFGESLGSVAPLYNLLFVLISVFLFIKLFRTPVHDRRVFLRPWKLIFIGVCIFIVEELLTFLRGLIVIRIPVHINGFFEVAIVTLFIYALLLQKKHMSKRK